MTWHKIRIGYNHIRGVQRTFDALLSAAGSPQNAAIYMLNQPKAGEVEIYFSPEAYSIANFLVMKNAGVPCNPPGGSVILLVGNSALHPS